MEDISTENDQLKRIVAEKELELAVLRGYVNYKTLNSRQSRYSKAVD